MGEEADLDKDAPIKALDETDIVSRSSYCRTGRGAARGRQPRALSLTAAAQLRRAPDPGPTPMRGCGCLAHRRPACAAWPPALAPQPCPPAAPPGSLL